MPDRTLRPGSLEVSNLLLGWFLKLWKSSSVLRTVKPVPHQRANLQWCAGVVWARHAPPNSCLRVPAGGDTEGLEVVAACAAPHLGRMRPILAALKDWDVPRLSFVVGSLSPFFDFLYRSFCGCVAFVPGYCEGNRVTCCLWYFSLGISKVKRPAFLRDFYLFFLGFWRFLLRQRKAIRLGEQIGFLLRLKRSNFPRCSIDATYFAKL